jgi:hypothetical protein
LIRDTRRRSLHLVNSSAGRIRRAALAAFLLFAAVLLLVAPAEASVPRNAGIDQLDADALASLEQPPLASVVLTEPCGPVESSPRFGLGEDLSVFDTTNAPGSLGLCGLETRRCAITYARNNPLKYVDPDGKAIETPWDALNVGIGVASFAANVAAGNVGGAVVDALGIVYDATATAVPVLPGGAGTAIRAARAADKAHDAAAALIAANRAAGKAAEAKIAAEVVEEGGRVLGSQVCCRTSLGRRVVDHVVESAGGKVAAVEVKSGNATRSAVQRAKDAEIAAGRGTFVGKNAPERLRGRNVPLETIERKPQ